MATDSDPSGSLDWIDGSRILIANNQFEALTGSEIHCLELADFFESRGASVTLVGLRRCPVFCASVAHRHNVQGRSALLGLGRPQFDCIWSHQETTFFLIHGLLGLRSKIAVHGLLSSYLEQEQLPIPRGFRANSVLFLANSVETQLATRQSDPTANVSVLKNIVPETFATNAKATHCSEIKKVAIVSNHVPDELDDAVKLLGASGIDVTIFGKAHQFVPIDEATLVAFDAVVTIGKTALYCLVQGVPLFLYDHFGGPGYFSNADLEIHEDANFSGRSAPVKKSAKEIFAEIVDGYADAVREAQVMAKMVPDRYLLAQQLSRLISQQDAKPAPRYSMVERISLASNYLRMRPRSVLRAIAPKWAESIAKKREAGRSGEI